MRLLAHSLADTSSGLNVSVEETNRTDRLTFSLEPALHAQNMTLTHEGAHRCRVVED